MAEWVIQKRFDKSLKPKNSVLIEGLPGMGQVGKIAVDYLVDILKPKLLYKIHSHNFWHSVYFNENGFVELPSVCIYYHKGKKRDLLFLAGDDQPNSPKASYEFSEKILDIAQELNCKEFITLGGIGMPSEVKNPQVFGAVTDKSIFERYKNHEIDFRLNRKVEAIVGASGLLLGLARLRGFSGIALLTETYGHPSHLGFKEAKCVLTRLKKIIGINIDLTDLERESIEYEKTRPKLKDDEQEIGKLKKLKTYFTDNKSDVQYIG